MPTEHRIHRQSGGLSKAGLGKTKSIHWHLCHCAVGAIFPYFPLDYVLSATFPNLSTLRGQGWNYGAFNGCPCVKDLACEAQNMCQWGCDRTRGMYEYSDAWEREFIGEIIWREQANSGHGHS